MSYTLLPPNASPFERRVEQATRFEDAGALVPAVTGAKVSVHPAFAPWLTAEWFLSDFARYFDTPAELIEAGLPWLRQRGTAAAVLRALAWIGFAAQLEEDGARLHVDPGTVAADRLADLQRLVNPSLPAHVQFYRVFHGYDVRHLRLDRARLDDALLDDDSGVMRDGVKLSFGTRHAAALDDDSPHIAHAYTHTASSVIWDDDSWRLDAWRLDSEVVLDAASGVVTLMSNAVTDDDEPAPAVARWSLTGAAPPADAEQTIGHARTDRISNALPTDYKPWAGPWTGPWREAIAARYSEET